MANWRWTQSNPRSLFIS